MTDKEIVRKAIDKAIANGWDFSDYSITVNAMKAGKWIYESVIFIIFSHSFLRAFFGEELITMRRIKKYTNPDILSALSIRYQNQNNEATAAYYCNQWYNYEGKQILYMWQYHSQQMILEENRIKYLEKFL